MSYCPQCGNKTLPNARFCAACGASFSTIATKQSDHSCPAIDGTGNSGQAASFTDHGRFTSPGERARAKAEAAGRPDDWEEFLASADGDATGQGQCNEAGTISRNNSPHPGSEDAAGGAQRGPEPMFFYIPTSVFIALSIITFGVYDCYWVYKNWEYIKRRDGLNISPFWRGVFGVWWMRTTFVAIQRDREATDYEQPFFNGNVLGWVYLATILTSNNTHHWVAAVVARAFGTLCIVPAQNYICRVNTSKNQNTQTTVWSKGTVVCILIGMVLWAVAFNA